MNKVKRACAALRIDIQPESPLRALLIGNVPADETVAVTLNFPSLDGRPTPVSKAQVLLEAAAEVEHALLVQYLYALFSLKASDAAHPIGMDVAIAAWSSLLRRTAIDEMGHLLTVQNLLSGIGLPPNVEREDFPFRSDLYPFNFHLDPLSERSLAKYVFAESPEKVPAGATAAFDRIAAILAQDPIQVNHVATLYALIGVVFMRVGDDGSAQPGESEDLKNFKMMAAALAREIIPPGEETAWRLPDTAWDQTLGRQAVAGDWRMTASAGGENHRVLAAGSRPDALVALADISAQGEGPGNTTTGTSHFARFFSIFEGSPEVVKFPGAGWQPVRSVPRDPALPENAAAGGSVMSDPLAQAWARVADASYGVLLGLISHYMLSAAPAPLRKTFAQRAVRDEMKTRLVDAGDYLSERPHTAGGQDEAALPFSLPAGTVNLPVDETERKAALVARYDWGLVKLAELKEALHQAGEDAKYPAEWEEDWKRDRQNL